MTKSKNLSTVIAGAITIALIAVGLAWWFTAWDKAEKAAAEPPATATVTIPAEDFAAAQQNSDRAAQFATDLIELYVLDELSDAAKMGTALTPEDILWYTDFAIKCARQDYFPGVAFTVSGQDQAAALGRAKARYLAGETEIDFDRAEAALARAYGFAGAQ